MPCDTLRQYLRSMESKEIIGKEKMKGPLNKGQHAMATASKNTNILTIFDLYTNYCIKYKKKGM